ncbi:hypothetical protein SARC_04927 [Sphaeroforma arctica JP610]|uniref:Uncharacterized protein n=1 Tax=Sphaeroforma arctica JP610 TaxID=667725 RepID=A0A0L0G1S7_9EUKA|nr:hypothetical protein SARC_04927 [Sphaeroforma arctica JP610]KNC82794.1 hypothetical protein SARC_04927 [Sphaeroforma arctica JP610]|eukprot:XP_014156696.1 hypothetical protein SARC_04927 [Sphaeroforma arctica JP610]
MKVFSQFILATCALSLVVVANPARRQEMSEMPSEDTTSQESGGVGESLIISEMEIPQETGDVEESLMVSEIALEDEVSCLPDDTCPIGYSKVANVMDGAEVNDMLPVESDPAESDAAESAVAAVEVSLPEDPSDDAIACQSGPVCEESGITANGGFVCCTEGYSIGGLTIGMDFTTCECIPGDAEVRRRRQEESMAMESDEPTAMESEKMIESSIPLAEETIGMCMCKKDTDDIESVEAMPTEEMSMSDSATQSM